MASLGDTRAVSLTLLDGVIGHLLPKTTNVYNLGSSTLKWANVYATTFNGAFTGNADTATGAHLTTTANAVAYYTDTKGTFGSKPSANGALYATQANGGLSWGTLPIAQGGTGKTSAADAWTALGGGASGKHADNYFALADHGTHVTTATVQSALSINTSTGSTAKCLTQKGTFVDFNNYVHPTTDGNLHVPATSNTNNGKVLEAGSSAGSISWVMKGNGRVFYGTTDTTSSTAEKAITCKAYDTLTNGDIIIIKFTNANSASSPTLNVNSTGAKTVKKLYNGAVNNLTANAELTGTCMFIYDGTYWLLSNADYNSTYTVDKVKQSPITTSGSYPILIKATANGTEETNYAKYGANVTLNPNTNTITATTFSGTATKISMSAQTAKKMFILGTQTTPSSATGVSVESDGGVYITTTSGEISAVRHSFNVSGTEKAYITFNSTDNSLDFIFN